MSSQVSDLLCSYLEARIASLEESYDNLRGDVNTLSELCHKRSPSSSPSMDHLRAAVEFSQELEKLTRSVHKPVDGVSDVDKVSAMSTAKANGSIPPHIRALPPHLRGKTASSVQERDAVSTPNSRLVTDGPVDSTTPIKVPVPAPSPPLAPKQDLSISSLSLGSWKPHFLTTLKPYEGKILTNATFHSQFLEEVLGGSDWSPGLKFVVNDTKTCIIRNRTYYLLDAATEPYLPEQPGQHGAKLTAFFNGAPECEYDLPEGTTSYEDVPMFVKQPDGRFAYFGNYTQSRWSDKLDYDTMMARVPQHIKEYWATELTSTVRPAWVTEQLKDHFFKKPAYSGRIFPSDDATTITSEDEVKYNDQMARDIRKYVEELREWEREANMRTALLKKQSILDAFDAADAADPPALRLWWEYLECVNWHGEFYSLLVKLQSREARFGKK